MTNVKPKSNVLAIAIMFFLFFMIAFVTNLQNPMAVISKAQFGASNAMSQLGNFMNFIAYACLGLPAGLLLKKKGYKFTAITAVTLGLSGVLITFLSGVLANYIVYLLGALVSGFSNCMLNTVVNPMLNNLGGGGNRGNRLNLCGSTFNSIGATLTPYLCGLLIGDVCATTVISKVNPVLYVAMGVFVLALLILSFSRIPEPDLEAAADKKDEEGVIENIKGACKYRNLVFGIIAICLYIGIEIGIPNMLNLYMTTSTDAATCGLGISAAIAGSFVAAYWFLMLVGRMTGVAVGGKVSSKQMMTWTSIAGVLFLLLAIFFPKTVTMSMFGAAVPVGIIFIVLCGLCTSVMWSAIFNLAVEGLGKYTAIASGLFMTMVVGGGVFPIIMGALSDVVGFLLSYVLIILFFLYELWYALLGSKPRKFGECK